MGLAKHRPSPALVVACLALAVALGGTSYAAITLPRNSVGTNQLKNNAVTSSKIRAGAITNGKIRRNAVTTSRIKNGSIKGWDVDVATLPPVPTAQTAGFSDSATNAAELNGSPASEYMTKLWAHVSEGLIRGHGVLGVLHTPGTGLYTVTFDRPIRDCAAFATISADDLDYTGMGESGIGEIEPFVVILPGVENRIGVVTTLADGVTRADYDFNLMVVC